jgi:hypothetical protein
MTLIRQFIGIAVFVGLVLTMAIGFTEIYRTHPSGNRRHKSRRLAYWTCAVLVLVTAIILGNAMEPCPCQSYASTIATRAFFIGIIPALIGVRLGLGPKRPPNDETQ